ncbi:DUF2568 domain-containing protein [Streptomyces sp. NPDC049954]|uniref:DUF2568 domain-containing protein n=1 Tax=Streptomyces sp. NPDC049954 TaxID=3155779 RepID=UPI0034473A18
MAANRTADRGRTGTRTRTGGGAGRSAGGPRLRPRPAGPLAKGLYRTAEAPAFLLELAALAALSWWGAKRDPAALGVPLALLLPLLAATVSGAFAAPRARGPLPLAGLLAVKALAHGAATPALALVGRRSPAGGTRTPPPRAGSRAARARAPAPRGGRWATAEGPMPARPVRR